MPEPQPEHRPLPASNLVYTESTDLDVVSTVHMQYAQTGLLWPVCMTPSELRLINNSDYCKSQIRRQQALTIKTCLTKPSAGHNQKPAYLPCSDVCIQEPQHCSKGAQHAWQEFGSFRLAALLRVQRVKLCCELLYQSRL